MKLGSETLKQDLEVSLEKQKQLHCTNVSDGPLHPEGKDIHKLSSSVVHKPPFQSVGDRKKVSFNCGTYTVSEPLPVKDTDVFNQKMVLLIGISISDGCKCEELEKEKKKKAVALRYKIAQLQEEVTNQANIIGHSNSELKEAQHKILAYKMELKQLQ